MNTTPDKCPHCGAVRTSSSELIRFQCGTKSYDGVTMYRSSLCYAHEELAATKRELSALTDTLDLMRDEFQRIVARMVEDGMIIKDVGQEILGICNRARSDIAQRVPVIAQRDAAEARVRELEGLAIGNQESGDGGLWVEVFIPTERLGGADCEGEECPTLGEAMPRKEEA